MLKRVWPQQQNKRWAYIVNERNDLNRSAQSQLPMKNDWLNVQYQSIPLCPIGPPHILLSGGLAPCDRACAVCIEQSGLFPSSSLLLIRGISQQQWHVVCNGWWEL